MGNVLMVFWPETHCFRPKIWEHIPLNVSRVKSMHMQYTYFLLKCFGDKSMCSCIFGLKQCISGQKTTNTFPIHLSPEMFWVI